MKMMIPTSFRPMKIDRGSRTKFISQVGEKSDSWIKKTEKWIHSNRPYFFLLVRRAAGNMGSGFAKWWRSDRDTITERISLFSLILASHSVAPCEPPQPTTLNLNDFTVESF
jgi:sarcosine oxidase delta subunit